MTKKTLIAGVVEALKENDIRKKVQAQKALLHITDDHDNMIGSFTVTKESTSLLFTAEDVSSIINACLAVIEDTLKRGESIDIRGFGTLSVNYRPARFTKHPETGERVDVAARYVPKFSFGNILRMAARTYEMSLDEMARPEDCIVPDDEEEDDQDW